MAITAELDRIGQMSQEFHAKATSILTSSTENLQNVSVNLKKDTDNNINAIARAIIQLENELEKNRKTIETRLTEIEKRNKQGMDDINHSTRILVQKGRKGALINDWVDVAKYGIVSATFNIPLIALFYFLFLK